MERVADYIIKKIQEAKVEHIFLVTGRGILFLTDALARSEVKHISTYHEQGAAYAAMAYAQARDSLGACLVSTGCGATNAITATLCAWQDNIPVIFISGQHMLRETTYYTKLPIRTYGSQEANIIDMVKPITKYATMLTDAKDVAYEVEKAIHIALSGRKGPVWLDIPLDIQNMRIEPDLLEHYLPQEEKQKNLEAEVKKVATELSTAERPLLLLGGGIRSADAIEEIHRLVEKTKLPVVFTPAATDCYGSKNELSIGAIGSIGGSRGGNFTLQNADYILAIGTKLCSQVTSEDYEKFAPKARLIVVDIDLEEHKKREVKVDSFIHADGKVFLEGLLRQEISIPNDSWLEKCKHWKKLFSVANEAFVQEIKDNNQIDLYSFSQALEEALPVDATVITDAGLEELIIPAAINYGDKQRCLFPAAQGAMGYAIPAILGAYYAGKKHIIAVVGDGSIMMNMQELNIISQGKIPGKIFVINNNMYAVIRKRQRDLFRNRTIGNDPSDGVPGVNFQEVATAFGYQYEKIGTFEELSPGLERVLNMTGPVICEVMCVEEQKYLHKSYKLNDKKRLEYRPLHDLSPFIDSDIINREMI